MGKRTVNVIKGDSMAIACLQSRPNLSQISKSLGSQLFQGHSECSPKRCKGMVGMCGDMVPHASTTRYSLCEKELHRQEKTQKHYLQLNMNKMAKTQATDSIEEDATGQSQKDRWGEFSRFWRVRVSMEQVGSGAESRNKFCGAITGRAILTDAYLFRQHHRRDFHSLSSQQGLP